MRILVIKKNNYKNSYTTGIHTLIEALGRKYDYQLLFTDNLDKDAVTGNAVIFFTAPHTSLINKLLEQQRLKSFIVKNKIDLLIQNTSFVTKQTVIPQLLITEDIDSLPPNQKINNSKTSLLTYSQSAKQTITEKGFTTPIHVIPFFAESIYQPITWSMKQQVKIDYAEGSEYFVTPKHFKSIDDILLLMKAFSGFKKWQQSSMKLVFIGKIYVPPSDWKEKLSTYKYREDILVCNELPDFERLRLLAGAYASIHLPEKDSDLLPLLESIYCQTPLITIETASAKEYVAEAGLTAAYNQEDITRQMILMYKDEHLRSKMVDNCALQTNEFSKENAFQTLQAIVSEPQNGL